MMCQGQPVLTTTVSCIMNKQSKLLLHTMIFCHDCGQSDAFWDRYVTFLALWRPSETSQEMFNAITCIQVAEQFRSSHSYQISKLYGLSTETQTIQVPLWPMQLAIQVGSRRQNESGGSATWWRTHTNTVMRQSQFHPPSSHCQSESLASKLLLPTQAPGDFGVRVSMIFRIVESVAFAADAAQYVL